MEMPGELLVEIYCPIGAVADLEEFFSTVETFLEDQEHGLAAESFDDGEEVGEHYVYGVWRAPEEELLEVARRVAQLPCVPDGTFALVTTTAAQLSGQGRRVDLRS
jgi:hypothetical protein